MKTIYILLADVDGTTRSRPYPIGRAVESEEEAKAWVKQSHFGYERNYLPVKISELDNLLLDEEKQ